MEVTRRDLFKFSGLAALGAVGATALAGTGMAVTPAIADEAAATTDSTTPAWLQQPEPITDFVDVKEFDVVVVGAGESGLAAAHTAAEAGAHVACVQNLPVPQTSGNMAGGLDIEKTSPEGIEACVSFLMEKNAYRSNRKLIQAWAYNSLEALNWWADAAAQGGKESNPYDSQREYNGYTFYLHANTYNHLEGAHNEAAQAVYETIVDEGVEFFFDSPAVQLVRDGERVTGVICETADGHVLFNATKGIILACGDYSGNQEMRDYYVPDLRGFKTGLAFRDGMGMMMGTWAGAVLTPVNHSKMVHGGGALTRLQVPFLNLNIHGERFMNETLSFAYLNNLARTYLAEYNYENPNAAKFFTIMPANWHEIADAWVEKYPTEVQLQVGHKAAPTEEQFISGETFEELAANMNAFMIEDEWGIDPIDEATIVASINAYNEICASGVDTGFGKRADYLAPIEQGPYYAVPRGAIMCPAVLAGLVVNENQQCLDENNEPIPGLFAAGNASGQFFGGVDYPMDIEGLSIGRAITSGYLTGRYVASLDAEAVPEAKATSEPAENTDKAEAPTEEVPAAEAASEESAPAEEAASVDCSPCHGDAHKWGDENPHGY